MTTSVLARGRLPVVTLAAGSIGVIVAGSVLVACGGTSSNGPGASSPAQVSAAKTVAVQLTNDGCSPSVSTVHSGPLTFAVTNRNATAVSELELLSGERIVGEKENLAPGFSGSFSLDLDAGSYSLYCPGASNEHSTLTVTGTATRQAADTSTSSLLAQGTKEYADYINQQVALLVTSTRALQAAIDSGDLAAARRAYGEARPYYERVEPVAESFTTGKDNLDADIDARINDVANVKDWTGFHRIERGLFQAKSVAGMKPYAAGLVANVARLQGLTAHLTYQPAELANGAVDLLGEVAKTKITGEEERYSHIDVLDFQANVEGAEEAFADIEPALKRIDATLAAAVSQRFTTLDATLDRYRDPAQIGGFVRYGTLTTADKRALAQQLQAVADPLSQVAATIVSG
jgi:iron uptake system component EfeO